MREEHPYRKMVTEEDLKDWPGAFPGRMKEGARRVLDVFFLTFWRLCTFVAISKVAVSISIDQGYFNFEPVLREV